MSRLKDSVKLSVKKKSHILLVQRLRIMKAKASLTGLFRIKHLQSNILSRTAGKNR